MARRADAQDLRGTVHDSLAGAPLAGAEVQLARAADPSGPLAGRATTDSLGRFVIRDLAAGEYLATFSHPLLDVLGIEPAGATVVIAEGPRALHLALPGRRTLHRLLCGIPPPGDSSGAVVGALREAATSLPSGGTITARWIDLVIGSGGVRRRIGQRSVEADPLTGRFLMCSVPGGVEMAIHAERGTDSTGTIPIEVPALGVMRRDVWIGSAAAEGAGARLTGSVRTVAGHPIAGAHVTLTGTAAAELTDSTGRFTIDPAPGGSRTLLVRALGYMPAQQVVDLVVGRGARTDIQLHSVQNVLDTVRVVAQRLYGTDRTGFERRRRMGTGTFIDRAEIERLRPVQLSDLFRRLPSARLEEYDGEKYLRMRGGPAPCTPVLFLDGQRISALGLSDLDRFVHPSDIVAVEVYTKELAPAEFTTLEDCGSVVIWTGHRPPPRRR